MRRLLGWISLLLAGVLGAGAVWLLGTHSGARWLVADFAPRQLPGLGIEGVRGTLWRGLSIEGLVYSGTAGPRVEVDRLRWRWRLAGLGERLLTIQRLSAARVRVAVGTGGSQEGAAMRGLALPLAIELTEARIDRFEWAGETGAPLAIEGLRVGLHLDRSLKIRSLEGRLVDFRLSARLNGEVGIDRPGLPLRLAVAWQAQLPVDGKPVTTAGAGELHGDLARLELSHRLSAPFPLSSRGQLRALQGGRPGIDLAGAWEGLRWPLSGDPRVISEAGSYRISGPLDALALQLGASLRAPDGPPVDVTLQGRWAAGRLELAPLSLRSAAGHLVARGKMDLRDRPAWSLRVAGDALDPSAFAADWPGRLSLRATSRGRLADGGPTGTIVLESLDGMLRGYPFSASGDIEIAGERVALRDLRLRSGSARLTADGPVSPALGLHLTADVPDLMTLLPETSGRLQFQGEASGPPTVPRIALHLEGADLVRAGLRLGRVLADIDWRPPGAGEGSATIEIEDLAAGQAQWPHVRLALKGGPENHRLTLITEGGPVDLQARLSGAWQGRAWRGRLDGLVADEQRLGVWSSVGPVSLRVSAGEVILERLCLAPDRPPGGEVCAEGIWREDDGVAFEGRIRALDLRRFGVFLPENLAVAGRLGGEFSVAGPPEAPAVQARLRLPGAGLTLRELGEEPITLSLSDGTAELQYGPDGLQASVSLTLQEKGSVALRLRGTPRRGDDALALDGRIQASLPDLALLAPLVPQARIRSGAMNLDATIGGTNQSPRVVGRLEVIDGTLDYPELGLEIRQLALAVQGGADGRLILEGSARSGPGTLRLSGEGAIDPRAPWRLRLEGERVQAVRLPDARVLVSPALRISGDARGIRVDGRLEIPEAEIALRELPEGAVQPSEDEVIVGTAGSMPQDRAARTPGLSGQIELRLGEKVHFAGFGLKTQVAGGLRVALDQGQARVDGNLELVEGRYRAWGQDLAIEQGRLLFAGPPDNPAIDLRAVRPSKDGRVKAYLVVTGTLRRPASRVHTEPPTSSTDALAYLLNGAPMGQSQGLDQAQLLRAAGGLGLSQTLPVLQRIKEQTGLDELGLDEEAGLEGSALAVGKYLTPDLYIRYVQGLFEPASVLALRYRLSRHLSVETRSGTTRSAELIYSIEHD